MEAYAYPNIFASALANSGLGQLGTTSTSTTLTDSTRGLTATQLNDQSAIMQERLQQQGDSPFVRLEPFHNRYGYKIHYQNDYQKKVKPKKLTDKEALFKEIDNWLKDAI